MIRVGSGRARVPASGGGITSPKPLDAIILCAGEGRRLRPLTESLPKVLVPVRGRALLDHHLRALAEAGTKRVILVIGYLGEKIRDHLGTDTSLGMEVCYVPQDPPTGTGDGLRRALPWITTDPFLLAYGDIFFTNLSELYVRLLEDRLPTIVAAEVPDVSRYGRLLLQEAQGGLQLADVLEKDPVGGPGLVNAGVFVLPSAILEDVMAIRPSIRDEFELTDALKSYVARGGLLRVLPRSGWADVGTLRDLEELNQGGSRR